MCSTPIAFIILRRYTNYLCLLCHTCELTESSTLSIKTFVALNMHNFWNFMWLQSDSCSKLLSLSVNIKPFSQTSHFGQTTICLQTERFSVWALLQLLCKMYYTFFTPSRSLFDFISPFITLFVYMVFIFHLDFASMHQFKIFTSSKEISTISYLHCYVCIARRNYSSKTCKKFFLKS